MSWSGERDMFQLTARIQWRCPMSANEPQGYDYGAVTKSPVSWDDFEDLKRVLGFNDRDQQLLLRAGEMIGPRLQELLGHWLEQLGPWVHATFSGPDVERYSSTAGARFGRGMLDGFTRTYDQEWLDYQHEIGLRHSRAKKNRTDEVDSVPVVPFRHLVASIHVLSEIPDKLLDGFLAGKVMTGHGLGLIWDIVVGILGAFLGGWLAGLVGIAITSTVALIIVAFVGAVILLAIFRLLTSRGMVRT